MRGFPKTWTQAQEKRFDAYLPYLGTRRLINAVPCLHVAGTNGKGSVCAMLESMLRYAGFKTGLFTSPHLYCQTERIKINGKPIEENRMRQGMARIKETLPHIGYFEQTFFCAMEAFEEQGCEIAVIETGIGGAMDVTNLVAPLVTVLTNIGLDHTAVLGDTMEKIALQKAGIAKEKTPMVLYPGLPEEAQKAIEQHCKHIGAPVYSAEEIECEVLEQTLFGKVRFCTENGPVGPLQLPLIGAHQIKNAQTALCAADHLPHAFAIGLRQREQGLSQTKWPGRMQWFPNCGGEAQMLIDGAHNPQAAKQLAENMRAIFPNVPCVLLCAVMRDKNAAEIVHALSGFAGQAVCTVAEPGRGLSAEALAKLFACPAVAEENPKKAYERAKKLAKEKEALLVVAGSLYLPEAIGIEEKSKDA